MDLAEEQRRRAFAAWIEDIRTDRHGDRLSSKDFAAALGVSRQAIEQWAGTDGISDVDPAKISVKSLKKLADFCGCSVDQLMDQFKPKSGVVARPRDRLKDLFGEIAKLNVEQLAELLAFSSRELVDRLASNPNPQPLPPASRIAYLLNKDMQRQGLALAEYAAKIELPEQALNSLLKGSLPTTDREALLKSLVSIHVDTEDGGKLGLLSLQDWERLIGYEKPSQIRSTCRVSTTLIKAPGLP